RPLPGVGHQHRRDGRVILQDIGLGGVGRGVEHLVGVGEPHRPAVDLHGVLLALACHGPTVALVSRDRSRSGRRVGAPAAGNGARSTGSRQRQNNSTAPASPRPRRTRAPAVTTTTAIRCPTCAGTRRAIGLPTRMPTGTIATTSAIRVAGGSPETGAAPSPTLAMTEIAPIVQKIGCSVAAKDRWAQPVACA